MLEGLVLEPILKAREVPAEKSKGTLEKMANKAIQYFTGKK